MTTQLTQEVWLYSFDEEYWYNGETFESREEAIRAGIAEAGSHRRFWTGKKAGVEIPAPNAWSVIETAIENVFEQVGEVCGGWLVVDKDTEKDLENRLGKVFTDWLSAHDLWPKFFRVDEIRSHEVPSHVG